MSAASADLHSSNDAAEQGIETTNNNSRQHPDQSADQTIDSISTSNSQSSGESHSVGLLTYLFWLPLILSYLNDADVVARLMITNKRIRRMLPKYSFKRKCEVTEALSIVQASRDITFSVTRVSALSTKLDELLRLHEMNNAPWDEVDYASHSTESFCAIPRFVTHLRLSVSSHGEAATLSPGLIPDSVVHLTIGSRDLIVQRDSIPSSVKYVSMVAKLDEFDAAVIPDSVTDLILSDIPWRITGPIRGPFPTSLKALDNIRGYDVPFVIPPSVTRLGCDSMFLSVMEVGAIPDSVTYILFDCYDEHIPKPGVLPDSVTSLHVSGDRIRFVPQWTPPHLTHLSLAGDDNLTISAGMLPDTVTHFETNCDILPGALSHNVTHVDLFSRGSPLRQNMLPNSVTHLRLNLSVSNINGLIPSSVTHLELNRNSEEQMIAGGIPESVTHLALCSRSTCLLTPGIIPQSVTHLTSREQFNQPLACDSLPRNLTHLWFGSRFNHSISGGIIPRTVTYLVLGYAFNHPILPGDIPPSVTHLAIGPSFSYELDSTNIPSSVTHLEIPRGYLKSDDKFWLPSSVTHISYKYKHERPEMNWDRWQVVV